MNKRGNAESSFTLLITALIVCSFLFGCNDHSYTREYGREDYEEPVGYTQEEVDQIKEDAYEEGYEDGYEDADSGASRGVTWATVFYTDQGECYHMNPSCLSLRNTDDEDIHETTLNELKDSGLRPCDICVPHSDD